MWSNWKNDGCPEFKKPESGKNSASGGGNNSGKQNGKSEEVMLPCFTNPFFLFAFTERKCRSE